MTSSRTAGLSYLNYGPSNFLEFWQHVCAVYSPGIIVNVLLVVTQIVFFWIPATILVLIDVLFTSFSNRHKIQSKRRQPTWPQIKECIIDVAINNITGTLAQVFIEYYYFDFQVSLFRTSPELPGLKEIATDIGFALVAREILFYYTHRALHHPSIYRYVHRKHHQFSTPIAFAGQYAHWLEHIVANVMPIMLPLTYRRAHILTFSIYLAYSVFDAAVTHSGYDFFPFPLKAGIHDLHHEKRNINYGDLWVLDWLHGTAKLDV